MKIGHAWTLAIVLACGAAAAERTHWVATWGASPAPPAGDETQMRKAKLVFDRQTVREIVHVSIGGDTVRVRLSNAYGKQPVELGAVHLALRSQGSSILADSDRAVTFSGRTAVTIPTNALVLSDPVKLNIPAGGDVAVSLFVAKPAIGGGVHYSAQQTAYIAPDDVTGAASITPVATVASWVFLTSLDVAAPESASAVVAFGDSITDGALSTVDANRRWPNVLADRLRESKARVKLGVVDAGIGGNRILHDPATNPRFGENALARFDRDVLSMSGVKYVIVLEGINDIGHPGSGAPDSEIVTADDIIAGLRQMIERAHEHGIKIFGATLTPFEGTTIKGYFSVEKERTRTAVNQWIRTGGAFDGVVDFDKAIRDPEHSGRMLPKYDGGDRLHPGDAGYEAMGNAIDLRLFR